MNYGCLQDDCTTHLVIELYHRIDNNIYTLFRLDSAADGRMTLDDRVYDRQSVFHTTVENLGVHRLRSSDLLNSGLIELEQ